MSYLVAFCRVALALVFLRAAAGKARSLRSLRQSIAQYRLLPGWLHRPAAIGLPLLEGLTTLCLLAGGRYLLAGFLLATALLLIFSAALASLLIRRLRATCNCFGPSERAVSSAELWRNAGLLLCAGAGSVVLLAGGPQAPLSAGEWALLSLGAAVLISIWLQLGEILALFQQAPP